MDHVSEKVGYNVLELLGQDDILHTSEYPIDNRKVVVFDDLINFLDKIQNKRANHYTDGRHHKISPICLS